MNPFNDGRVPPLAEMLRWMTESDASDLHLSGDAPPALRRDGALEVMEGVPPLSEADLDAALEVVAGPAEREMLAARRELDKALFLDGAGRFRVNVGYERGRPYFSFRRINDGVLSIEDLGLPAVCNRLTQLPRGLVLVTGADRQRQVHDARGDDRPHQRDARTRTSSRSRIRSSSSTTAEVRDHPARGRRATRELRATR